LGRRASRERSRSEEGEGLLLQSAASGHRRTPVCCLSHSRVSELLHGQRAAVVDICC
jgi:hypothetical protein